MGLKPTDQRRGHEGSDLDFNIVMLFAVSLVIALIVVHYAISGIYRYWAPKPSRYPSRSSVASTREEFSGPRLTVNQSVDMEKQRASEKAVLNSYGWVDRDRNIVHIPVERAIDLLAERGLSTNTTAQGGRP